MNCSFTEKVSSLIDGELSATETRDVERHLLSCTACQQLRADFLNLHSQLKNFETSLQPEVQNRALKKILATGERRVPARGLRWSFGTQAIAFASLVIVAAIIGTLVYINSNTGEQHTAVIHVPAATPEPSKQPEAKASPEPAKENEQQPAPNKSEENTPRRAPSSPAKRPLVREPKPGEQFASIPDVPERVRSADAETMTAMHFEKSETLLRAFRNARLDESGGAAEVSYERKRAQQLIMQNMMLRREADAAGDVQISSLLESLEPILIDIANLPAKPDKDAVRAIRERVERKNIVALLQVNSTALARALD
ncbi:MAG TPA: zf-HC2 domain-containing protein [Pyrinomonadaceae bacterium]|nr:zf-HC2 domain-containing protein [Pyrinomonadaceae bacterium]